MIKMCPVVIAVALPPDLAFLTSGQPRFCTIRESKLAPFHSASEKVQIFLSSSIFLLSKLKKLIIFVLSRSFLIKFLKKLNF